MRSGFTHTYAERYGERFTLTPCREKKLITTHNVSLRTTHHYAQRIATHYHYSQRIARHNVSLRTTYRYAQRITTHNVSLRTTYRYAQRITMHH